MQAIRFIRRLSLCCCAGTVLSVSVNNIPIGEFYAVAYDMERPFNIYGGTQDNAALFGPSTHVPADGTPDPWRHVYLDKWGGGDSYATLVDPNDSDRVYYEHQFGVLRRKNMATGETKGIRPRAAKGSPSLRYNWMTPFFISYFDSNTLYCGTNLLFKSTDRGDSWTAISGDLTTNPDRPATSHSGRLRRCRSRTLPRVCSTSAPTTDASTCRATTAEHGAESIPVSPTSG